MKNPEFFKDKNILITGGTGSFGRAMARTLLKESPCKKVIIFSRDEWKQWDMRQSDPIFNDNRIRYFLGDIRDRDRLTRAFNEVDFVIHAAALKQVPAAEYNPSEFVNTNIIGAMNIIDAAIDCKVAKVVALSTDKAVNPINLYGATKLCSDKLFVAGNVYVGARKFPQFFVVRYGNVLGSRASIIPLWKKMVAEGATSLPVTDERMTRFWITLQDSVNFVLDCLTHARGAEVFVPKIASMKIIDLAKAIAPQLPVTICGIRPGEKLHEVLISAEDARHTLEYENHFIIAPEIYPQESEEMSSFLHGRRMGPLPEGFSYTSDTNKQWLAIDQIQQLINAIDR